MREDDCITADHEQLRYERAQCKTPSQHAVTPEKVTARKSALVALPRRACDRACRSDVDGHGIPDDDRLPARSSQT